MIQVQPALIINGREDEQGRALFVISALYHCIDLLQNRAVRFLTVDSIEVDIAIRNLEFDTGLRVAISTVPLSATEDSFFRGAGLYVAVAFDNDEGLHLWGTGGAPIPQLIPMQFPPVERMNSAAACHLHAAQDPAILAQLIRERLS